MQVSVPTIRARHDSSAQQPEGPSSSPVASAGTQQQLPGGAQLQAVPAAATPVAPASDLQSRKLRLLPWQTSAGAAAAAVDGYDSSSDAAAARRAFGDAASTSGRGSAAPATRRRGAAPGGSVELPASGGSTEGGSTAGAPSRAAAARTGAVCEACGGRGVVASPSGGLQPCHACQQWRQRPEYSPGARLTLSDVDFAALDSSGGGDGVWSGSDDDEGSGDEQRLARRKTGPMSAERKAAISRGVQSKGAKSEEHRR